MLFNRGGRYFNKHQKYQQIENTLKHWETFFGNFLEKRFFWI